MTMTDPFAGTPAEGADEDFLNETIDEAQRKKELQEWNRKIEHLPPYSLKTICQKAGCE